MVCPYTVCSFPLCSIPWCSIPWCAVTKPHSQPEVLLCLQRVLALHSGSLEPSHARLASCHRAAQARAIDRCRTNLRKPQGSTELLTVPQSNMLLLRSTHLNQVQFVPKFSKFEIIRTRTDNNNASVTKFTSHVNMLKNYFESMCPWFCWRSAKYLI